MDASHLSPAETAKRFGTSIKALRLYEQRGLLVPLRTSNGSTGSAWRVYGPDQIIRLHQILALKRLGLSLSRIGELLASTGGLDPVLALQERALARDGERLAHALALVRAARAKLASGQALSIDDLANLTKETVMDTQLNPQEVRTLLEPFTRKHLSKEQQDFLVQMQKDNVALRADIEALFGEFASYKESGGDAASPIALDMARRWLALSKDMRDKISDSKDMPLKMKAAWEDAMADTETGAKLAARQEVFAFIGESAKRLKKQTG